MVRLFSRYPLTLIILGFALGLGAVAVQTRQFHHTPPVEQQRRAEIQLPWAPEPEWNQTERIPVPWTAITLGSVAFLTIGAGVALTLFKPAHQTHTPDTPAANT